MHRKRHLPAAIAAACLLLTATACDGDPDPQGSTPTSTPPSTPTPTPSKTGVAPPTMPPAARGGFNVTSAEAFARFYVAAIDYAQATGDVRLMQQWQDPKRCVNCKSIATTYAQTYRNGGTVAGQLGTKIVQTTEARLIDDDIAVVKFKTHSGRTSWRKTAQSKPINLPGGAGDWEFALQIISGRWMMSEVVIKE